ncbi:MAG: hypothetical protein H6643_11415 [Caldilineaceae bacterium]|nr:hypothetical protein [Caldilineaceae bacterium]
MNTWFHIVHGAPGDGLVAAISRVPGLKLTATAPDDLPHALWERSALGYLLGADGSGYLLELTDRAGGAGSMLVGWSTPTGRGATWAARSHGFGNLRPTSDLASLFVYRSSRPTSSCRWPSRAAAAPASRFAIQAILAPQRAARCAGRRHR